MNFSVEIDRGKILYANPFLQETIFRRSVIVLTDHGPHGTMGLIINKKLDIRLNQLIKEEIKTDIEVYLGGPVGQNALFYLHNLGITIPESKPVADGWYFGGDFEVLRDKINNREVDKHDVRFFIGYSGWGEHQLETELREESWVIDSEKLSNLLNEQESWQKKMIALGDKYALWGTFPEGPFLN
ncbi:MAG: YqgE/AlgH family protein [Flavobacteriales bacterium]|nr:YqgE/AlgH family protein [Flavobacteriales bacterium]